jgi:hypothetical protein
MNNLKWPGVVLRRKWLKAIGILQTHTYHVPTQIVSQNRDAEYQSKDSLDMIETAISQG